jgi:hypothetical protein
VLPSGHSLTESEELYARSQSVKRLGCGCKTDESFRDLQRRKGPFLFSDLLTPAVGSFRPSSERVRRCSFRRNKAAVALS